MKNVMSQSLGLDLVNINVYATVYQNIPLSSRDRAIFTFSEFEPRPIPNDISQSLGLHLLNINARDPCYHTSMNVRHSSKYECSCSRAKTLEGRHVNFARGPLRLYFDECQKKDILRLHLHVVFT